MAQGLIGRLSGCDGPLFELQTMLFQLLQARTDLFFPGSAESAGGVGKLIGPLDDQHKIVYQALQRGLFRNQVLIVKLHKTRRLNEGWWASTCTSQFSFLNKK